LRVDGHGKTADVTNGAASGFRSAVKLIQLITLLLATSLLVSLLLGAALLAVLSRSR
jgi:hypothetical protein